MDVDLSHCRPSSRRKHRGRVFFLKDPGCELGYRRFKQPSGLSPGCWSTGSLKLSFSLIRRRRGILGEAEIVLFCPHYTAVVEPPDGNGLKIIGGKMTLSSAMAISGAAANPNTGAGGETQLAVEHFHS